MPAYVLALYGHPTDPVAFDAHYDGTHVPLALALPGLTSAGFSIGPVIALGGDSPYHRVAVLHFDSLADAQAAFASPEGQATAGDLANFATGGVTPVMFEAGIPGGDGAA